MHQRSAPTHGRHRRKRRFSLTGPAVLGSLAVLAAATGAVTLPQAGATAFAAPDASVLAATVPARPAAATTALTEHSGTAAIVAAQQAIAASSTQTAQAALEQKVAEERRVAADRAARAEREARSWVAPTSNYRITATFGSGGRRWSNGHTGLDFAAPAGTPVRAASSGTIISAGYDGAYGNKIAVQHADGTVTWYCHLSAMVRTTGAVRTGEEIGRVGTTGNSSGPHLHLEVRPGGGDPIDPRGFLARQGIAV